MDKQNRESLEQQVAVLTAMLEQQASTFSDYQTAQKAQLKILKGELMAQDHRFIPVWRNLFNTIRQKEQREHLGDALTAVLHQFIPNVKTSIVLGASLGGIVTLLLMFQSNQLTLQQNQYFQKQIYIQAESDRRDQLVNIMEKLYEPTESSLLSQKAFDRLPEKDQQSKIKNGEERPALEPKYNAQARTQSSLGYLNIKDHPLEQPTDSKLPSLYQIGKDLWASLMGFSDAKSIDWSLGHQIMPCDGLDRSALSTVKLNGALLQEVDLSGECLALSNLFQAELTRADLETADLSGAVLINAVLRNANLKSVNLKDANLAGADLLGTDLRAAENLTCEQLTSAVYWDKAQTDLKCEGFPLREKVPVPEAPLGVKLEVIQAE